MSDEPTRALRSESRVENATIYNRDTFGLTLGDLRKLIAAAEGIPDDAEVTVEELRKHYSRIDVYLAKRVSVRSEAR
jgi:hypothetical protein